MATDSQKSKYMPTKTIIYGSQINCFRLSYSVLAKQYQFILNFKKTPVNEKLFHF